MFTLRKPPNHFFSYLASENGEQMKAIIVEDERLSIIELRNALAEITPRIEVSATAQSVGEAVALIRNTPHDLIFMDIHLGDGSSFDIFKQVEVRVPVIFITAYDHYALQAFRHQGIDYLLKPFGRDDLQRAVDKLGLLSAAPAAAPTPAQISALEPAGTPAYQSRFLVSIGTKIRSVSVEEVAYFMADGKYVHLRTREGADYIVDQTLTSLAERVSPIQFFQINRKFLVSFHAIREMVRYSNNRIKVTLHPTPPQGSDAIVSADRIQEFRQWLNR